MPVMIPDIETKQIRHWREERDHLAVRQGELTEAWTLAHALASQTGDVSKRDESGHLLGEMRAVESAISDTDRAIYQSITERRSEVAREIMASKEFATLTAKAIIARADRLAPEAELVTLHISALRVGAQLDAGIPGTVLADIDTLVRWAREAVRRRLVDKKQLPQWLSERLTEASQ